MDIENEYKYETTMEQILFHMEQLVAEVLLGSIKRLTDETRYAVNIGFHSLELFS